MYRRTLLVGMCALTAGCIRTPTEYIETNVQDHGQTRPENYDQIDQETLDNDPEAVIVENPNESKIYVYRTLQLPDPTHNGQHDISVNDEQNSIRIIFNSESEIDDGSIDSTSTVIQPQPYWVELELVTLQEGINIEIETIAGDVHSYTTTGEDTIGEISSDG